MKTNNETEHLPKNTKIHLSFVGCPPAVLILAFDRLKTRLRTLVSCDPTTFARLGKLETEVQQGM